MLLLYHFAPAEMEDESQWSDMVLETDVNTTGFQSISTRDISFDIESDEDRSGSDSDSFHSESDDDEDDIDASNKSTKESSIDMDVEDKNAQEAFDYSQIKGYGKTTDELINEFKNKERLCHEEHARRIVKDVKARAFLRAIAPRPLPTFFNLIKDNPHGIPVPAHNIPERAPASRDPFRKADPLMFGNVVYIPEEERIKGTVFPWIVNVTATFDCGLRDVDVETIALIQDYLCVHHNTQGFKAASASIMLDALPAPCVCCIRLFSSGKVTIAGTRTEEQALLAAHKYVLLLNRCGIPCGVYDFHVDGFVGSCDFGFKVNIMEIHKNFPQHVEKSEKFPPIKYKPDKTKGSSAYVFDSGKCMYMGTSSIAELRDLHIRTSSLARAFNAEYSSGITITYLETPALNNITDMALAISALGSDKPMETLNPSSPPRFTEAERLALGIAFNEMQHNLLNGPTSVHPSLMQDTQLLLEIVHEQMQPV